jgi:hypothetical protein
VVHTPLPQLFTGRSAFLQANPLLVHTLVHAAGRCRIESSEDIFDANGILLWVQGKPVSPALLDRLSGRLLAKPIELCVRAQDPVSLLAMEQALEALGARSLGFQLLLSAHRGTLLGLLRALPFNPQELLMLSAMRYGETDRLEHALAVAAVAVAASHWLGLPAGQQGPLVRAALMHDVGLLYLPLPAEPEAMEDRFPEHPQWGAAATTELMRCDALVAQLVACSHERIDGHGFPRRLRGAELSLPMQALSFAEAVAGHLADPARGAQRATLCSRLVPGEFARPLVDGIANLARRPELRGASLAQAPDTALLNAGLRQLHGGLARACVILSLPFGEEAQVRGAVPLWLERLQPLMHALRLSGVEDALARGRSDDPIGPQEACELEALRAEIQARLAAMLGALRRERERNSQLQHSRLVDALLLAAGAALAAPQPV